MPRFPQRRSLLLALACAMCALLSCIGATAASAESYSELARFGGPGVEPGKFAIQEWTHAFGVDPEDSGVYVGDEPAEETKTAKFPAGVFRVQKLSSSGAFLGVAAFKAKCRQGEGKICVNEEKVAATNVGIEGIAFDTVTNSKSEPERRLYVLSTYERPENAKVDSEEVAAAALYAFSTKPEGSEKKLAPAVGTEGVLADPETLNTESKVQGAAVLNPKGITVDPTTHDIIIAGEVDLGPGAAVSEGKHLVLQRVTSKGALGARYIDPVREYGEVEPNSPVVTQSGQVLLQTGSTSLTNEKIVQIPSNFSSTAPKTVYELDNAESIIEFGEQYEPRGGGLALAPETGRTGTLYANATINPFEGGGGQGVLELHYDSSEGEEEAHVSELGWTAGNVESAAKCSIGFEGILDEPIVAGDGSKVFVLEPGAKSIQESDPHVVEFGPAVSPGGCPEAKATEPVATVEGVKVSKVHVGSEVTLSSAVEGANALSVEWSFGDGTKATVSTDENGETSIVHTFAKAGTLTVEETIHTDDLATPLLKLTTKVVSETSAPTARFTASEVAEGEATSFNGSTSTDPNGVYGLPVEYTWEFGDGTKSGPSTEATTKHTYAKSGAYTATLKVTDKFALVGKVEHTVTVKAAGSGTAPKIEKSPSSVELLEGSEASFEAGASGSPPPTVQWEVSTSKGEKWSPLAGQTADVLKLAKVVAADSGYEYRAVFTNANGSVPTVAATLTVESLQAHKEKEEAKERQQAQEQREARERQEKAEQEALAKKHQEEGNKGVLPITESSPDATIAGTSIQVSAAGVVGLKVSCPTGDTSCIGTVTIRTLNAVAAGGKKKAILTLGTASFTVAGGSVKAVTLHLSAKGRALLGHSHTLRVRATVLAHNVSGATHTGVATITLRAAKAKGKH